MTDFLLVVARSARMAAQLAVRVGFKPLVIDLYGDRDTREAAVAYRQVTSLAWTDLAPAVAFFVQHYPVDQCIYGSGFESHINSLYRLSRRLPLAGNPPDVFARAQDKPVFFSVLSTLNIPYPETRFSLPEAGGDWLIKPLQGQGGMGIRRHIVGAGCADGYWQRFQPGIAHSLLFLADGRQATVVGFNRQWTTRLGGDQAFVFAGIINCADISESMQSTIDNWLAQIVAEFALRGLNSLDFIVNDQHAFVLEVNPRIPASLQLYSADWLRLHSQASDKSLLSYPYVDEPVGFRAFQIVYAPEDIMIPGDFNWPAGCVDRPVPGSICRKKQPICSIIAHHLLADVVCQRLEQIRQTLFKQLYR